MQVLIRMKEKIHENNEYIRQLKGEIKDNMRQIKEKGMII